MTMMTGVMKIQLFHHWNKLHKKIYENEIQNYSELQ